MFLVCYPRLFTFSDSRRYRTFGPEFIRCIWIHQVDGAVNTKERFDKAFKDVPAEKYQVYTTEEIPKLKTIDVAKGDCKWKQ